MLVAAHSATVAIDGELLAGAMPSREHKLLQAWLIMHEDELYEAWNNAVRKEPLARIEPLK